MKKVKTFVNTFIHSLIPYPTYYSKIIHLQFKQSFIYFILLIFILNLIFIASIFNRVNYHRANGVLQAFIVSLKQIPGDYSLRIVNGTLFSSYDRPFFLWMNYDNNLKLLAVVDEYATADKINLYRSSFLLTTKEVITKKDGLIQTIPLSSIGALSIDKAYVNQYVIQLESIHKYFPLIYICILITLLILIPVFSFITSGFYLLVSSFIGFYLYKIFTKKHITWKKTVQIALHASTLPLIVDYYIVIFKPSFQTQAFFSMPQGFFPIVFIFLLTLFIVSGLRLAHEHSK